MAFRNNQPHQQQLHQPHPQHQQQPNLPHPQHQPHQPPRQPNLQNLPHQLHQPHQPNQSHQHQPDQQHQPQYQTHQPNQSHQHQPDQQYQPQHQPHHPFMTIVEQPKNKDLRFRYATESRKAGNIYGENHTEALPTFPTIKVFNLSGPVTAKMFCVTSKGEMHPHKLVGADCSKGVYVLDVHALNPLGTLISLKNVGVQCCKKDDISKFLECKKHLIPDAVPLPANLSTIDLTRVCLMFQLNQHLNIPPLISRPIIDKRHCSDLTIVRVSRSSCAADGGVEVFILCNKVKKDDIEVVFSHPGWEDNASFCPTDVFKDSAIVCKIPSFHDRTITSPVTVQLFLREVSSKETGNKREFTYTPTNTDRYGILGKRKALSNCIHQQQQLFNNNPITNFSNPNFNATSMHPFSSNPSKCAFQTASTNNPSNPGFNKPIQNQETIPVVCSDPGYFDAKENKKHLRTQQRTYKFPQQQHQQQQHHQQSQQQSQQQQLQQQSQQQHQQQLQQQSQQQQHQQQSQQQLQQQSQQQLQQQAQQQSQQQQHQQQSQQQHQQQLQQQPHQQQSKKQPHQQPQQSSSTKSQYKVPQELPFQQPFQQPPQQSFQKQQQLQQQTQQQQLQQQLQQQTQQLQQQTQQLQNQQTQQQLQQQTQQQLQQQTQQQLQQQQLQTQQQLQQLQTQQQPSFPPFLPASNSPFDESNYFEETHILENFRILQSPTFLPPAPQSPTFPPQAPQSPTFLPPAPQSPTFLPPAPQSHTFLPPAPQSPTFLPPGLQSPTLNSATLEDAIMLGEDSLQLLFNPDPFPEYDTMLTEIDDVLRLFEEV